MISDPDNMTPIERVNAMETLWDAMYRHADKTESPAWHQEELARRRGKLDAGEAAFSTLEELKRGG